MPQEPSDEKLVELDGARIVADADFIEPLVELGLDTLRGVYSYEGEGYQRSRANRENYHLRAGSGARTWDLYLKRHRGLEPKELFKLLFTTRPFRTAGRREWENIRRLEGLGIPTMRRVAFGERRFLGLERRSFVITEAIPGAVSIDRYIRENFTPPLSKRAMLEKRALLWEVGALARRLHRADLTHMDLYINHFFVRETEGGDRVLHLIDLQRVARRRIFRRRWVAKDLAALIYSAGFLPLSRTDMMRIFAAYFDGRITAGDRRLLRRASRRARRIAERQERRSRRNHPGAGGPGA